MIDIFTLFASYTRWKVSGHHWNRIFDCLLIQIFEFFQGNNLLSKLFRKFQAYNSSVCKKTKYKIVLEKDSLQKSFDILKAFFKTNCNSVIVIQAQLCKHSWYKQPSKFSYIIPRISLKNRRQNEMEITEHSDSIRKQLLLLLDHGK